jgi:hypothetical protein
MHADLFLHGKAISSVFDLLGHDENDITYSVGWALAECSTFRGALLSRVLGQGDFGSATVRLQERVKDGGITDIELLGDDFHIIVEAKRGWEAPAEDQLRLYLPRIEKERRPRAAFVTMSECTGEVVAHTLPQQIGGFPVVHLAWHEVQTLARSKSKVQAERRLLDELVRYLENVVKMQNKESNWVMTVAISDDKPEGFGLTFKEIVLKKSMYFHPVGGQYSQEPVNYLGLRWDGHLQAIHHVQSWEVVRDIHKHIPELSPGIWPEPHYLYRLGPAIVPSKPIPIGKIYAPGPVHAMIDLLLTSTTVAEARTKSNERIAASE